MHQEILDFWFSEEVRKLWFNSTPEFDARELFAISRPDFITLCLPFPCVQSGLGYERFAHLQQPPFNPRAIMAGFDAAIGQLGNPLHLFVECA